MGKPFKLRQMVRKIFPLLGVILLLILSGCSHGQKRREVELHSVALYRVPNSDHWMVDGFVGSNAYQFILDTGAGITSLRNDAFTSQFPSLGTQESSGAFAKQINDLINVPSIRLGTFSTHSMKVRRVPKSAKAQQNLLGLDVFREFAVAFKFKDEKLALYESGTWECPQPQDLLLDEKNHPYVTISWKNGTKAAGVWDSGAGTTVFDLRFIATHPDLFVPENKATGKDSSGAERQNTTFHISAFRLGGKEFPAMTVVGVDLSVPNSTVKWPMAFILGENALSQANWIFDLPKKKWAVCEMVD